MKKKLMAVCVCLVLIFLAGCSMGENQYSSLTQMSKRDVESFAKDARETYLEQDWVKLSDMISYPVQVGADRNIKNKKDFIEYMKGRKAQKSALESMEKETCTDMFVNGDGICMADGMLWLIDENFDGIEQQGEPELRIYSINGIK